MDRAPVDKSPPKSPKSPRSPSPPADKQLTKSKSTRRAIKIVGLSGGIKQGSISQQALELALDSCGKSVQTQIIDLESLTLPFRDELEDDQKELKLANVAKLRKDISEASGLIVCTPEYHNSYSGGLKNALDWLTGQELRGKVVGLISVSAGDQENQAISHLRDVFRSLGSWVIGEQAAILTAPKFLTEKGCQDDITATRIRTVGQATSKLTVLYIKGDSLTFLAALEESQKKNAVSDPQIFKKKSSKPQKVVRPEIQIEDITEKIYKLPKVQDKLVIIGGGFAGLRLALKARSQYQVIMIDTKDYWEFTPSIPRVIVQPERAKNLVVPYEKNLKEHFFRGRVSEVHPDYVLVDQKYRVPFNYLVISSGSRYPSSFGGNVKKRVTKSFKEEQGKGGNMKDQFTDMATRIQALHTEAARAKAATTICIIGGGIVGCELLAELAMRYPTKKLVLIHAYKKLLNNTPAPDAAAKFALNFFQGFSNVQLVLGHRVTESSWSAGKWTIGTDADHVVVAEKVYFCAGLIPNSEMMRAAFDKTLDAKGFIQVDQNFQVSGTSNIYALGDVASGINDLRTAYAAGEQAKHFIANLSKIKDNKVKSYKGLGLQPMAMGISLGPFRGIFMFAHKIVSTKALAVGAKNMVEVMACTEFGQDKSVFKPDLNKQLKAEIRNQKNVIDIGGDDDEDAASEDVTKVHALFGSPEASSGDVFHYNK